MTRKQIIDKIIDNIISLNRPTSIDDEAWIKRFSQDVTLRLSDKIIHLKKVYYFKSSSVVIYEYESRDSNIFRLKDYSYEDFNKSGLFYSKAFTNFEETKQCYNRLII